MAVEKLNLTVKPESYFNPTIHRVADRIKQEIGSWNSGFELNEKDKTPCRRYEEETAKEYIFHIDIHSDSTHGVTLRINFI